MSTIKKTIILGLSTFLTICMILSIFSFPAEKVIFDSASYQKALIESGFYKKITGWTADFLLNQSNFSGNSGKTGTFFGLDRNHLEGVISQLLPAAVIEAQGEILIRQVVDYLDFNTDHLDIVLDLKPYKERLNGPDRRIFVRAILESWPECTGEQILEIAGSVLGGNFVNAPLCRPTDEYLPFFENIASQLLSTAVNAIPDQAAIRSTPQPGQTAGEDRTGSWENVWGFFRAIHFILKYSPVAVLVLIIMLALVCLPNLRDILMPVSLSIMIGGCLSLVIALGFLFCSQLAGRFMVQQLFPAGPLEILEIIRGVFVFVFSRFSIWSMASGFCAACGGLIVRIVSETTTSGNR